VTGVAARASLVATSQLGSIRRFNRARGADTEAAARRNRFTSSRLRSGVLATAPIRIVAPTTPMSVRRHSWRRACLPPSFVESDHSSGRAETPPPKTTCHCTLSPRRRSVKAAKIVRLTAAMSVTTRSAWVMRRCNSIA
jgi:hypothetical protein